MNRLLILILLFTCTGTAAQQVRLDISHVVGNMPMQLKVTEYHNAAGDTFTITVFRYYLSNFTLSDATGKAVNAEKAYFLVSEDSTRSKQLLLKNCPAGKYTRLSFMIGVDSVLNFSGPQSGALDPMYGMFWTWNSGYIMAKLEGFSPSSRLPNHMIQFHIGGYRAPHVTQRLVTLELPTPVTVSARHTPQVSLEADAATWFDGLHKISFRQTAGFMAPGTIADRIADNYQHMFTVKEVIHRR
ncbi:MbnP family protein [Chitinophaga rhizophila]|uniref:Copper-binding protein MbnP-like domain-containing protein n=1 Tax=Chitinophaga rhizophila TaxID=2866212 RepID=A0ABS7G8I1_9BACT|nr:MbnP family protein [Chitinophaga rhizophila]MBW8683950.1 hypothetical protein [Chitinophaga rhizophila]